MYSCHSILECGVLFSGVKLSIRSFVLFRLVVLGAKIVNSMNITFQSKHFCKAEFTKFKYTKNGLSKADYTFYFG